MSTDERYNGWTNRETWAVALYINNDQGWQESVLGALREEWLAGYFSADQTDRAGEIIRENVEQVLTVDGYEEMTGEDHLPAALSRIAEDIGSLYRVNWDELGAAFLSDLEGDA
jgi:heme oxygenase